MIYIRENLFASINMNKDENGIVHNCYLAVTLERVEDKNHHKTVNILFPTKEMMEKLLFLLKRNEDNRLILFKGSIININDDGTYDVRDVSKSTLDFTDEFMGRKKNNA